MKKFASFLPARAKLALLQRHFARSLGGKYGSVVMVDRSGADEPLHVSLHKNHSGIGVVLDFRAATDPAVYRMLYARLPAVLEVFARTPPGLRAIAADLTDGEHARTGEVAFASNRDDVMLVPDPVFVNSRGYAEFRRPALALPWMQRRDTVLWRGTATGVGAVTTATMTAEETRLRPRVRMCLILRGVPGTDVKIRKTEHFSATDRARLIAGGVMGNKIRQSNWGRYKFALDIDGHTNAWSNFFVRLLLGCCVLKVQSELGFRQWYYDRLTPWRHYVPVDADMTDLIDKIAWCRGHDAECAAIAANGHAVAHAMSVEAEIAAAARLLEAAPPMSAVALADGRSASFGIIASTRSAEAPT